MDPEYESWTEDHYSILTLGLRQNQESIYDFHAQIQGTGSRNEAFT